MAAHEIERRTGPADNKVEYRDDGKTPIIIGYAAVFNVESRNLGGFVETIHPRAFDKVLAAKPDVVGVYNHDKNFLLGRTGNGTMTLSVDDYGLRYMIQPPLTRADVVESVARGDVIGSSFAFRANPDHGDVWTRRADGLRHREIREIELLDDAGPVVRPAYDATSVVVSRRALEMALGESFRPSQTMANAAKRGLKLAERHGGCEERLLMVAERLAAREIVSTDEVSYLAEVQKRCLAAKETGWSGSPAWIEWQLAGGDAGSKWSERRNDERGDAPAPKKDQISGSDKNKPDSAKDSGGDIELDDAIVASLQKKADDHNEEMKSKGKPDWTRVRMGALKAVYRRGAGAFSVSHRPGMTRGQWAMARVNAFLYLAANGKPENEKYVSDNDLLAGGHPKKSEARDEDVLEAEVPGENDSGVAVNDSEARAAEVNLKPTAAMASACRRGLKLYEDGRGGDGLVPATITWARRIVAGEALTKEKVVKMRAWHARHKVDRRPGWDKPGAETPGFVAYLLWAGSPGARWSSRKVAELERAGETRDMTPLLHIGEDEHPGTLSAANEALYEAQKVIAEEHGKWSQEGPAGACYKPESPKADRGYICGNCLYYVGGGGCEIVEGDIAANGICKLNVIPEEKLAMAEPPAVAMEADDKRSEAAIVEPPAAETQPEGTTPEQPQPPAEPTPDYEAIVASLVLESLKSSM